MAAGVAGVGGVVAGVAGADGAAGVPHFALVPMAERATAGALRIAFNGMVGNLNGMVGNLNGMVGNLNRMVGNLNAIQNRLNAQGAQINALQRNIFFATTVASVFYALGTAAIGYLGMRSVAQDSTILQQGRQIDDLGTQFKQLASKVDGAHLTQKATQSALEALKACKPKQLDCSSVQEAGKLALGQCKDSLKACNAAKAGLISINDDLLAAGRGVEEDLETCLTGFEQCQKSLEASQQ